MTNGGQSDHLARVPRRVPSKKMHTITLLIAGKWALPGLDDGWLPNGGLTPEATNCVVHPTSGWNPVAPEASAAWLLLPVPAMAVWLSSIGHGCLTDWMRIGPDGMRMGEAARCFDKLLLTGVPLSVAMLVMLRFCGLFRPHARQRGRRSGRLSRRAR